MTATNREAAGKASGPVPGKRARKTPHRGSPTSAVRKTHSLLFWHLCDLGDDFRHYIADITGALGQTQTEVGEELGVSGSGVVRRAVAVPSRYGRGAPPGPPCDENRPAGAPDRFGGAKRRTASAGYTIPTTTRDRSPRRCAKDTRPFALRLFSGVDGAAAAQGDSPALRLVQPEGASGVNHIYLETRPVA